MSDSTHVCEICGGPRGKYKNRYCAECGYKAELARKRGRPARNWTRPCQCCGSLFTNNRSSGKYCSPECGARSSAEWHNDQKLQAAARRKQREAQRLAELTRPCGFCGVTFVANVTTRKWCSEPCRHAGAGRLALECAVQCGECRRCGKAFCVSTQLAPGFCSKLCNTRHNRSLRKAKKRSLVGEGENFTLLEIAERDGWHCHLCGKAVPNQPYKARDADPTIDHLIPVSKGGEHTRANVSLAHNRCNWERSDADLEFQLRLIA